MTDYTELIKALRLCQFGECGCGKCYYKELKGDWCTEDNHPEFFDCDDKLKLDAADAIEALKAEVERLKGSNEELRERQTYIDHYGDKWLTSAKDVPTAAYEHGYADGRGEAEAQLSKHGEWVEDTTTYAGPGLSNYKCSLCGKICGTWRRGLKPSELPNWCGNCGADMRKMEVQE